MATYIEVALIPLQISKSGLAVLCDAGLGEGNDVWLPLSQFETPPDRGDIGLTETYEIQEWLAKDKGLI